MRIVDIAEAAGVSPSTVSRVIHGDVHVSAKTEARVRRALKQVGYPKIERIRHRKHLRSLAKKKGVKTVAVLSFGPLSAPDTDRCSRVLNQITANLYQKGFSCIYIHLEESPKNLHLDHEQLQGVFVLAGQPDKALLNRFKNVPIISLFCPVNQHGDHILTGHYQLGRKAGQYLLNHSVEHLVLLNALPELPRIQEQARGFMFYAQHQKQKAFTELQAPFSHKIPDLSAPNLIESRLCPLVEQLCKINHVRTGVFIPCDWMTAIVYRILYKKKIDPSRFVFVSSGSIPSALAGLHPRPATIDIGLEAIAEYAVNLLLLRIQSGPQQQKLQIAIQPTLIKGDLDKTKP